LKHVLDMVKPTHAPVITGDPTQMGLLDASVYHPDLGLPQQFVNGSFRDLLDQSPTCQNYTWLIFTPPWRQGLFRQTAADIMQFWTTSNIGLTVITISLLPELLLPLDNWTKLQHSEWLQTPLSSHISSIQFWEEIFTAQLSGGRSAVLILSTSENCLRTCACLDQLKGDSHPHSPKTQTQPQNTNALGDVTNGSEEEMCQSLCCPGDTAVSVPSPTVSCQAATCKFRLHGQLLFFFSWARVASDPEVACERALFVCCI